MAASSCLSHLSQGICFQSRPHGLVHTLLLQCSFLHTTLARSFSAPSGSCLSRGLHSPSQPPKPHSFHQLSCPHRMLQLPRASLNHTILLGHCAHTGPSAWNTFSTLSLWPAHHCLSLRPSPAAPSRGACFFHCLPISHGLRQG